MKFVIINLLMLMLFACALNSFAEMSVEDLFRQGNKFYETGDYRKAIEAYQAILDSGMKNGYVYYNLGNALLREKLLGEAILVYERAQKLLPRDEDVAFNLEYARALTLDKMEGWSSGKFESLLVSIRDFFTPNEVTICFLGMYVILTILTIAWMFASRRWKTRIIYGSIPPLVLFLLSGIIFFAQISSKTSVDEAILIASKSEARTGPGEGYSTVFEIHEGAKVRIQREKLDWVEIKLPNKVIGWVMKKDLAKI